ncbi:MAG TPA: hypothetical protein VF331_03455 [Polyangiales bacterium]
MWRPTERWVEEANVTRFMRKLGYRIDASQPDAAAAETRAFIARSAHDIEWFWRAALVDFDHLNASTPPRGNLQATQVPTRSPVLRGKPIERAQQLTTQRARQLHTMASVPLVGTAAPLS